LLANSIGMNQDQRSTTPNSIGVITGTGNGGCCVPMHGDQGRAWDHRSVRCRCCRPRLSRCRHVLHRTFVPRTTVPDSPMTAKITARGPRSLPIGKRDRLHQRRAPGAPGTQGGTPARPEEDRLVMRPPIVYGFGSFRERCSRIYRGIVRRPRRPVKVSPLR
jgi:hypothetical protein